MCGCVWVGVCVCVSVCVCVCVCVCVYVCVYHDGLRAASYTRLGAATIYSVETSADHVLPDVEHVFCVCACVPFFAVVCLRFLLVLMCC